MDATCACAVGQKFANIPCLGVKQLKIQMKTQIKIQVCQDVHHSYKAAIREVEVIQFIPSKQWTKLSQKLGLMMKNLTRLCAVNFMGPAI